jgi:PAS domain S-box-containing protein
MDKEASSQEIGSNLANILSSIKEYALYLVNLDGYITYFGMGAEVMFGWGKNEILTKHLSTLHLKEDINILIPLILDQVRKSGEYEIEIYLVKKNGQSFLGVLSITKLLDANGELTGYIFIAKDISARKKLERQVSQAEKIAALRQLAVGLGDEINNLLVVISGRLQIILEQEEIDERIRENLDVVDSCADRLRKVVGQILKFSRNVPQKFENININEVIESVFTLLAYHNTPSTIITEKDLAQDLPLIKGDFNQLQEAFLDLFLNAYQEMPRGGKLTIKTSNFMNHHIEIRIIDTGFEVSQENSKNINSASLPTKKEWTGLDLLICYNIINNLNGSLDIESQGNRGTTFIIRLPLVQA